MMQNVLAALLIIERLAELVRTAEIGKEDITDEQLQAAFDRADKADAAWLERIGKDQTNGEQ
jgi:hypothetical protein